MKLKTYTGPELRDLRRSLRLNQSDFWSRYGVTQSGASRYESSDREIPRPLQILLNISLGTDKQAQAIADALRDGMRSKNTRPKPR